MALIYHTRKTSWHCLVINLHSSLLIIIWNTTSWGKQNVIESNLGTVRFHQVSRHVMKHLIILYDIIAWRVIIKMTFYLHQSIYWCSYFFRPAWFFLNIWAVPTLFKIKTSGKVVDHEGSNFLGVGWPVVWTRMQWTVKGIVERESARLAACTV